MDVDKDYDLGFNHEHNDYCDYVDYADCREYPLKRDKSGLSVMQLNIRGLLNKQENLKNLLDRIKKQKNLDVVLIVETWLKKSTTKKIDIPGYKFIGSHREGKKRGGGVGILIANKLQWRIRKDLTLHIQNFENLTIEVKTDKEILLFSTIYRPPNTPEREFLKNYKRFLGKFTKNQLDHLIIGLDHNMDFLKSHIHTPTKNFIDLNLEHSLLPAITKPTRITRTTATLIDNILLGQSYQNFTCSKICIEDISDHLPSIVPLPDIEISNKPSKTITTRVLDQPKIDEIHKQLYSKDWKQMLTSHTVNDSYNIFHDTLQQIIDTVAPLKTVKISGKKLLKSEWMTNGLNKCLTKQTRLYKQSIKNNMDENTIAKYKTYRNMLKQIMRKRKEDYYKTKCIEYRSNSSKLWRMINKMTNNERDKTNMIECLKINNIIEHRAKIIAQEFGKHFSSIGMEYAKKVEKPNKNIDHYVTKIPINPKSIFLAPCTKIELNHMISNLPNKNSAGFDNISNKLLKSLKDRLLEPLELIFNQYLNSGIFPDLMKLGDVVPLYKSKERYLTTNYRPISLLTTLSKILEKIMYKRTYNFLTGTNQIYSGQYGFRNKHSTENAISELLGRIIKGLEHNRHTISVFLDLSKAFDTLNHRILLDKLERYGIRGIALEWFHSYLLNRKLRCKYTPESSRGTEYSDYYDISYGTPQGSCLGPLLFLVFTNDLHMIIENGQCLLFADDTTLYQSHQNLQYLKWNIQEDLKTVMDWFKANQLTLNLDKTVCLLFSPNNKTQEKTLELDNMQVKSEEYTKFLGLWIDKCLNWNKHVNTITIKLKQNTNMLRVGNKFLTKHTKKLIYHSHILSHLTNGLLL